MSLAKLTAATTHYPDPIRRGVHALASHPVEGFNVVRNGAAKTFRPSVDEMIPLYPHDIPDNGYIAISQYLTPCLFAMSEVRLPGGKLEALTGAHWGARLLPHVVGDFLDPLGRHLAAYPDSSSFQLWMTGMSSRTDHNTLSEDMNILTTALKQKKIDHAFAWEGVEQNSDRPMFYRPTPAGYRAISDIGFDLQTDCQSNMSAVSRWFIAMVGPTMSTLAVQVRRRSHVILTTFFLPDHDPIVLAYS